MKTSWLKLFILLILSPFVSFAKERPNILWVNSEDNGAQWLSCYGSPNAKTPNLDKLANEGFRYTHCYSNSAVCAPTRTTWITGVHAISMGTQPMRSRYAIPHDKISYWPDHLSSAGYHAAHMGKTDYNIGSRPDNETWKKAKAVKSLKDLTNRQPFVAFTTLGGSHESAPMPTKKRGYTTDGAESMVLHPYHPDLPKVRATYTKYAQVMAELDLKFEEMMVELEELGLKENTIVIYVSDHGGILPRSKRFLYTSGIHCPLIIRIPEKFKHLWPAKQPGHTVDRMVSFIDMPKTILSLIGANIPESMQGSIFLGSDKEPEPKHHFSYRGRADHVTDMVRALHDKRYLYIKNYMPWAPHGQFLSYMWALEATKAWHDHFKEGKCSPVEAAFFNPKSKEELYDQDKDYHNIHNLIDQPNHQKKISELRKALREKQLKTYDSGLLPEIMRMDRAKRHGLTVYEMVRNPDIYPLEQYLDYADMILEKNPTNLEKLIKGLEHKDEGIRFWSICGLAYLGEKAKSAEQEIEKTMNDPHFEVSMMAYYAMATTQNQSQEIYEQLKAKYKNSKDIEKRKVSFLKCIMNLLNK